MSPPEFLSFLISASLGALIGLERQWEKQQDAQDSGAGLRTFVLIALLGTTAAHVDAGFVSGFYPVGFGAVLLLLLAHVLIHRSGPPPLGLTTLAAAVLTFFIGSLVYWAETKLGLVLTVCILLLLAGKRPIHQWSRHFTEADVHSALLFLALTGVVLPLAPNVDFGPYGAFNPFKIWLMVVLVAGLGFFGYVAVRVFGARAGLGTMGVLGGLTSSTVTTLAFSRQSREQRELARPLALSVNMACTIMFVRVAVLCASVSGAVFNRLWPALLLMALPGVVHALLGLLHRSANAPTGGHTPEFANPLGLKTAVQFAILYAFIVLLARAGAAHFGGAGIGLVSFLSGLTDMDAIALSLSQSAAAGILRPDLATRGIVIAAISNTVLKAGVAVAVGDRLLSRRVLLVQGATVLCGVVMLVCPWPSW